MVEANGAVVEALQKAKPAEEAVREAREAVIEARSKLSGLERQRADSLRVVRSRFRSRIGAAKDDLNAARSKLEEREMAAEPFRAEVERATTERNRIDRELAPARISRQLDQLTQRSVARDALGR